MDTSENIENNFPESVPQNLAYAKNSTALKYFIKPPLDPLLRVHIFNYTNADRFMSGLDDKLIVEDIGPFTYVEKLEKVNVTYNNNDTISYRVSYSRHRGTSAPILEDIFFVI